MRLIQYIKAHGIKKTIRDIYEYQIDKIILQIIKLIFKNKELQDIIMIESHDDFDCNGGAFYDYLISKGYNDKYKIVWLLKHPKKAPKYMPQNVVCVPLFKPSIRKNYYEWVAKYFTADNISVTKQREGQCSVYLTHGAGGLKNVKGLIMIPDYIDYILFQSENYAPIQADQYSLPFPSNRIVYIGYPAHDILLNEEEGELGKLTSDIYKKVVLWMPTFRKGGGENRNDSLKEQTFGIPLIDSKDEYIKLNEILKEMGIFLIIKIHPKQDLSNLGIDNMSNINVLTAERVKKKNIDNYRLMKCADALISDYSGAAYEYLQLNRPIAYVLDDAKEYKNGFVVDDIQKLMAGHEIYTLEDLFIFLNDVMIENDQFMERRKELRDYIYKYHDTKSSERLVNLLGLQLVE